MRAEVTASPGDAGHQDVRRRGPHAAWDAWGAGDAWDAPDTGVPHTRVHRLTRRLLEPAQDVLVVALALILFVFMARTLMTLGTHVLAPVVTFREVVAEVLFMLVLVELLRLVIVYLRDHRVAIDTMVEISIVSTLREVVLHGIVDFTPVMIAAIAGFVLALGLLLRFGDLRVAPVRRAGPASRPAVDNPVPAAAVRAGARAHDGAPSGGDAGGAAGAWSGGTSRRRRTARVVRHYASSRYGTNSTWEDGTPECSQSLCSGSSSSSAVSR